MRLFLTSLLTACLCIHGQSAVAKQPNAVFGSGTVNCRVFVNASENGQMQEISDMMFSWVQGWFSARNAAGRMKSPLTVAGTLSADALKAFLVSDCKEFPDDQIVFVADRLYDRLAAKGQ
jgi:hypothetical protein